MIETHHGKHIRKEGWLEKRNGVVESQTNSIMS